MLYDVKKANIMKKVKEGRKVVYKNHNLCWNSTFGCFPICCFGVKSEKSTFDAEVGPGVVIFYKTILNFIILFTCMTLFSIPAYITYFAAGDEAAKELQYEGEDDKGIYITIYETVFKMSLGHIGNVTEDAEDVYKRSLIVITPLFCDAICIFFFWINIGWLRTAIKREAERIDAQNFDTTDFAVTIKDLPPQHVYGD